MQMARTHLRALEEELRGIEETEKEMQQLMSHADALEAILGATKKLVRPSMHAPLLFSYEPHRKSRSPPCRRQTCRTWE